jgi:chromate transporter
MHDELVDRKQWIGSAEFLHALSHCMLLPGPEAQQLAIYIGWKLHGRKGGLVAGSLFVLPSTVVLLALSVLYVRFGNLPLVTALLSGLKPAVVALVILATVRVARRTLTSALQRLIALAAFLALALLHASVPQVLLAVIPLGLLLSRLRPSLLFPPATTPATNPAQLR